MKITFKTKKVEIETRESQLAKMSRSDLIGLIMAYEDQIIAWGRYADHLERKIAWSAYAGNQSMPLFVDLESVIADSNRSVANRGTKGNSDKKNRNSGKNGNSDNSGRIQGRMSNSALFHKAVSIRKASGKSVSPHNGDTKETQESAIADWCDKVRSSKTDDQMINDIVNFSGNWGK